VVSPAGPPRQLTRLTVTIAPSGALQLQLHAANRITWFVGASDVNDPPRTAALMAAWAPEPRTAVDSASWRPIAGTVVALPSGGGGPALWEPPSELDSLFAAAFVEPQPSARAGRAFGESLARALADFVARSRQAAHDLLAQGWADRAQARLAELRRIVDPAEQSRAGSVAARLGSELHAVGFLALAPDEATRRLYEDLQRERQLFYNWQQALAHLGISAARGSGEYP
jgi:hypothetical protein